MSIDVGFYGNGLATQVAKGFAVSKGSQGDWRLRDCSTIGPPILSTSLTV